MIPRDKPPREQARPAPEPQGALEERLREMNEALLVSLVRQQELADQALAAERLQHENERVRQRQLTLTNALRVSTVGELAAGLAHELNQPLSSISNLVEACAHHVRAGKAEPEKFLQLLSEAAGECMRAAGIIAHLRSFISKGEPQFEPVDLREVVGTISHLLARDLELARTELRVELPSEPLPVRIDRIQIEQVLVNLIGNAIDSINEAGGEQRLIELTARVVNGTAEVSVRDTGGGVGEAAAEQLFRPFFTTKTMGLGMGLALSRSILEAHQGRIWMEKPDDGGEGLVVRFAIRMDASS